MGDGLPKGSVVMADPKQVDKKVKDYLERARKIAVPCFHTHKLVH